MDSLIKKRFLLFLSSCLVLLTSCGEDDPSMPLIGLSMIDLFSIYEITNDSKNDDLTFTRCSALLSVYSDAMDSAHERTPKNYPRGIEKSEMAQKIAWQFRMINSVHYPNSIYNEDKFRDYFESLGLDEFSEFVLDDSNYCAMQSEAAKIKYKIIPWNPLEVIDSLSDEALNSIKIK